MKKTVLLLFSLLIISIITYYGCKDSPVAGNGGNNQGTIPSDPPDSLLPQTIINNLDQFISNPLLTNSGTRISLQLAGVMDPVRNQYIQLKGTGAGENIWVSEDCDTSGRNGKNKGVLVTPLGGGTTGKADIVFVVDNSGSTDDQADSIANQITSFVNYLSGVLDVRVGCVGYQYGPVTGAVDLTTVQNLSAYLNRPGIIGSYRTIGFLDSTLYNYSVGFEQGVYNEDGIVAISFADEKFTHWRSDAQRIYINFTDEAMQPTGNHYFSNAGFKERWSSLKGTVHTVFSVAIGYQLTDTTIDHNNGYAWGPDYERPWDLSVFTGGTWKIIYHNCSNLSLKDLPVSGSLANSFKIEFIKTNTTLQNHNLKIVIVNQDSVMRVLPRSDGKRVFTNLSY